MPGTKVQKRRCWVVCRFLGEASEVWLHRQILGFRRFDPEVVCWRHTNPERFPVAEDRFRRMDFNPLPENGPGRWALRFENFFRGGNFYGALGAERRALVEGLDDYHPKVILSHYGHMALRVLPVARERRVPVVAHFHGVDITAGLSNRWYRASLGRCLDQFAAMVVVADYQRETLLELGASPERIHVIPCGVPVNELSRSRPVGDAPCRFVSVGRFADKKSPLSVIRAFDICAKRIPETSLTMVGEGPLLRAAKDLARQLGIEEKIKFTGGLPPEEVVLQLGCASVFVQHSVTAPSGDKEGWPVSIAEAMAAGLPVISTQHAGIVDQVDDGGTGILVAEGDWQGMGEAMANLAQHPRLRSEMGIGGRTKAAEKFDIRISIEHLEGVLEEAAGHRMPNA